jgi:hypothetical protein
MILKKIISGGQCGADEAGLWAAKFMGIPTGGWAPFNYQTKKGNNPELKTVYGLKEWGGYKSRTWKNAEESDGTIRFAKNFNSPGERCTLKAIEFFGKPHFDIDLSAPAKIREVACWIRDNKIQTLNIAGNTQYKNFDVFDITRHYLCRLIKHLRDTPE